MARKLLIGGAVTGILVALLAVAVGRQSPERVSLDADEPASEAAPPSNDAPAAAARSVTPLGKTPRLAPPQLAKTPPDPRRVLQGDAPEDEGVAPIELTALPPDTTTEAWQRLFGRLDAEFEGPVARELGAMFEDQCRYRRSRREAKQQLLSGAETENERIDLAIAFESVHLTDDTPLDRVATIVPAREQREVVAELLSEFHAACE